MKKQKGMTLVEIVISMAIYGILALLLTEIMTCVNASMRATHQLNNRLSYEAKFADNQLTSGANANFTLNTHNFEINYGPSLSHQINTDHRMVAYEWTANMFDADIVGERYATDINYRFMKFAHEGADIADYPGHNYRIAIRPVAYLTRDFSTLTDAERAARTTRAETEIQHLDAIYVVNGDLIQEHDGSADPVVPYTAEDASYIKKIDLRGLTAADLDTILTGDMFFVDNNSNMRSPDDREVSGIINFASYKFFDINGSRESSPRLYSTQEATYFTYVRLGDSETNATFYDGTLIEFDVLTGEMEALPAVKQGEDFQGRPT
jgi:prepilin-type N-terminal cleavage/methylation domain-containing protein